MPATIRRRVDLPAPLGPTSPNVSPASTAKLMSVQRPELLPGPLAGEAEQPERSFLQRYWRFVRRTKALLTPGTRSPEPSELLGEAAAR
jgi:hypothetical protein